MEEEVSSRGQSKGAGGGLQIAMLLCVLLTSSCPLAADLSSQKGEGKEVVPAANAGVRHEGAGGLGGKQGAQLQDGVSSQAIPCDNSVWQK